MKLLLSLFCFFIITGFISAQNNPGILDSLHFADTQEQRKIYFGIDPAASDTLDFELGEANLPPFPPAPAMEVRFILPIDNFSGVKGSYKDFRNGSIPFSGQKEHRVKIQSRGSLKIDCNLPPEITIHVEDLFGGIIVNADLVGIDTLSIPDNIGVSGDLKMFINYNNATEVEDEILHPVAFSLSQNYPNPFNPSTTIDFTIGENQFVNLKIFDMLGREIATLVDEEISAGSYSKNFDATGLSSGIYFYILKTEKVSQTKSMILLK